MRIARQLRWNGHANRSCSTVPCTLLQSPGRPAQIHRAHSYVVLVPATTSALWKGQPKWRNYRSTRSVRVQATPDVRVATSFVLAASTLVTAGFWWYYITQLPEQQQVPQSTGKPRPKQQDGAHTASSSNPQAIVTPEEGKAGSQPASGAINTVESGPGPDEPRIVYKKPPSDTPYLLLTLVLAIASAYTVYTKGWR